MVVTDQVLTPRIVTVDLIFRKTLEPHLFIRERQPQLRKRKEQGFGSLIDGLTRASDAFRRSSPVILDTLHHEFPHFSYCGMRGRRQSSWNF